MAKSNSMQRAEKQEKKGAGDTSARDSLIKHSAKISLFICLSGQWECYLFCSAYPATGGLCGQENGEATALFISCRPKHIRSVLETLFLWCCLTALQADI